VRPHRFRLAWQLPLFPCELSPLDSPHLIARVPQAVGQFEARYCAATSNHFLIDLIPRK
jgi:hypothetical protein